MKKIIIIGSGFSSLSAACYLAKKGNQVQVVEKNDSLGGRARQFKKDGFTFDIKSKAVLKSLNTKFVLMNPASHCQSLACVPRALKILAAL